MRRFQDLKLRTKLFGAFLTLVAGAAVTGGIGTVAVQMVNQNVKSIYEFRLKSMSSLFEIQLAQTNIAFAERGLLDARIFANPQARRTELDRLEAASMTIEESISMYAERNKTADEEKVWKDTQPIMSAWLENHKKLATLIQKKLKLNKEQKAGTELAELESQLVAQKAKTDDLWTQSNDKLTKLLDLNVTEVGLVYKDSQRQAKRTLFIQLAAILAVLAFAVFISRLLARSVTLPILRTVEVMQEISTGRLGSRFDTDRDDELGTMAKSLNKMSERILEFMKAMQAVSKGDLTINVSGRNASDQFCQVARQVTENLQEVIGATQSAVHDVTEKSHAFENTSQVISSGASEQAASVEEISSSLKIVDSQAKANAQNTEQANNLIQSAAEGVERSKKEVARTLTAIQDISRANQEIVRILRAIDEIAFQTNLLALNAAVEAARAGKHGKGFAVVAEEVRNLAGKSAKASDESRGLIENSMKTAASSLEIANGMSEMFNSIVKDISRASQVFGEIVSANQSQAQALSELATGLQQIGNVTQQNAAAAQETASAAQELTANANGLQQLVSRFRMADQKAGSQLIARAPQLREGPNEPVRE